MRLLKEEADEHQDIVILDVSAISLCIVQHAYYSLSLLSDGRQYRFRQNLEVLRMGCKGVWRRGTRKGPPEICFVSSGHGHLLGLY